jgi:hypothetical protein
VLDAVREVRPKPSFSPEGVIANTVAPLFKAYRINRAKADRWAGGFPVDRCAAYGIKLEPAERTKSELYGDFLATLNSQRCELLDLPRLKSQLLGLERSVRPGGKDMIDHPRGQHDDIINSAVGAMVEAGVNKHFVVTAEHMRQLRSGAFSRGAGGQMTQYERLLAQNRRDGDGYVED